VSTSQNFELHAGVVPVSVIVFAHFHVAVLLLLPLSPQTIFTLGDNFKKVANIQENSVT